MRMSKKTLIQKLHKIGFIHKKPVELRSGIPASFYCDIKKAYGYPEILTMIADEIIKLLPKKTTCIAASGYGGLPLGAVVASRAELHFTAVRDNPKKHGKGGVLDGYVPTKKDAVVIVDDVLTTGSSIKATLGGLATLKIKVIGAVVVVKRQEVVLPLPYKWVLTLEEVLLN